MDNAKLGSEVVSEKYGPVSLRVLSQTYKNRESLLVNQEGVIGAYSLVFFGEGKESFSEAHRAITNGAPIGKTFRELGIPILRDEFCSMTYPIPRALREITRWNAGECSVKGVDFLVGNSKELYATIIEMYGPLIIFPEFEKFFKRKEAVRETLNTRFRCW